MIQLPEEIQREEARRKEFADILFYLASSLEVSYDKEKRRDVYIRLEALYYSPNPEERFRHFYSDIFIALTTIAEDPSRGNLENLGFNLECIRIGYQSMNNDVIGNLIDIKDSINKLYDHVSLDIARIKYAEKGDNKTSGEESIRNINLQIEELKDQISNTTQDADEVKEKISNQQKEYISILGIFAAVVLAVQGGISFAGSVFESISQANPYRIIIIGLLIGLVTINILFTMFYCLSKIVNNKGNVIPQIIANALIFALLIATVVAWNCGIIEKRDNYMQSKNNPPAITQTSDDTPETANEAASEIGLLVE